jgi:predicted transcriptional regulator
MNNLNKIGISDEEYSVYKTILTSPPDNISKLAKEVNITRVTLYKILDLLEEKGLIRKAKDTKLNAKYIAESPDVLLEFIKRSKEESNHEFENLTKQIPILKALAGDSKNLEDSGFLIFRGTNILEEIDNLILSYGEQLYGFTYEHHVDACFDFDKNHNLKENPYLQVVLRCGDRFVFPGNEKSINTAKRILENNPFLKNKWEPRWIDAKKFKMKVNFYCFANNVAFSLGSHKQQDFLAYVIQNKEIAESMRDLSIFLWENANTI